MKKLFIDASAWIEYFEDTEKGKMVAKIVESEEYEICTPMSVVAEVVKIHLKKRKDPEPALEGLQQLSFLIPLTMEGSINAAKLCSEYRSKHNNFGMLDAFILATARELGGKVLTFDNGFRQFKETIIPS